MEDLVARGTDWQARRMRVEDLEQVMSVEREIYPFPWTPGNFVDSLEAGYDLWLFEEQGRMIGYAVVMWLPDEVHLLNLSVAAACQGRGYGRQFLHWLCADSCARGALSMLLEVRPSNAPALALYAASGFEKVGVRKGYYPSYAGSREDALVLRKVYADE